MRALRISFFVLVVTLLGACGGHLIPRTQWPLLGKFKPEKPVLLETKKGMFYLTSRSRLAFVRKDGKRIVRSWQEISLAHNKFTAISQKRETFTFPLSEISEVVAYGKLAGEITGVKVPQRGAPPPGRGGLGGRRPMFR